MDVFVSAKGWLEATFMSFMASVAVGYPTVNYTPSIFMGMEKGGVSIIEFGNPYTNPHANGTNIHHKNHVAIKGGESEIPRRLLW